jgi:hypothetical protein
MAEANPAQSGAQAKTTWVRNCTPDHLRLHVGGTLLVFAPLQRRRLDVDVTRDLEPLVQQGVLDRSKSTSDANDQVARLIEALPTVLAFLFVGALMLNGWLGAGALIAFGALALVLITVAVLVAGFGSSTVARLVGQMVMLSLVVVISIGVPALVVWRYGLDDLGTDNQFSELARMLQVIFIALACMVPGLLFFLFDRQRLSTLRDRFEQQIFRLDPRVTTLADVEARYGNQLDEMYGQNGGSATARLARQGRWPIPLATVVLAFGWILTLLPVTREPQPESLAEVALSFAPQANTVAFGFLGAYFFAINLILRRYARDDLRPKAYSTITVRVIVAVLLGWLVDVVAPDWSQLGAALLVVAFLIGIVPETFLTFLQEVYRAEWVRRLTRDMEEPVPLSSLEGIDLYDRARLLDEGIANVEALANHDLIDLLLETRVPAARLIDWMDQAILHLHTRFAHDLCDALRRAGIRTASDLVTVYGEHEDQLIGTLGRSMKWERGQLENAVEVLVASLSDDEWMNNIRYWRTGSTVHERTITVRDGRIIDGEPEPGPGDGERPDDRPVVGTAAAVVRVPSQGSVKGRRQRPDSTTPHGVTHPPEPPEEITAWTPPTHRR